MHELRSGGVSLFFNRGGPLSLHHGSDFVADRTTHMQVPARAPTLGAREAAKIAQLEDKVRRNWPTIFVRGSDSQAMGARWEVPR